MRFVPNGPYVTKLIFWPPFRNTKYRTLLNVNVHTNVRITKPTEETEQSVENKNQKRASTLENTLYFATNFARLPRRNDAAAIPYLYLFSPKFTR